MMVLLLALGALALWGAVATVVAVGNDGYRQLPVDQALLP